MSVGFVPRSNTDAELRSRWGSLELIATTQETNRKPGEPGAVRSGVE